MRDLLPLEKTSTLSRLTSILFFETNHEAELTGTEDQGPSPLFGIWNFAIIYALILDPHNR